MTPSSAPPRVLFLCTGNSCRSQMAEGFARALLGGRVDAHSAGTRPHGLNPLAVRAMAEAGVDISRGSSKRPEDLGGAWDAVITVCGHAHESCPVLPGAGRVLHAPFDDPPRLAAAAGADDDSSALPHYRRVRDEIRAFVLGLPARLASMGVPVRTNHQLESPTQGVTMNQSKNPGSVQENPDRACGCGPACCGGESGRGATAAPAVDVREQVRRGYGEIARRGGWSATPGGVDTAAGCCAPSGGGAGGCCGPTTLTAEQVAAAVGYGTGELSGLPEGANLGLSCGNPTAIADLRPGETVLDLGSGAGLDCFIAGPKVGAAGRAIGVDMTPDMLAKARRNLAGYRERSGLDNVEFRLGEIESLPVADASVDVVISNCVINLSPDKPRVFREIARVLRPGGRVAVSDLALLRPLPDSVRADVEALVGCVAGAALIDDLRTMALQAGLRDVRVERKAGYVEAMTAWQDPLYRRIIERLPAGTTPSDFITSVDLSARKA